MNIDSLTIGEAKELVKPFGGNTHEPKPINPAIGKYCIVRCRNAGVHAGVVVQANDSFVELKDSRRLWCWKTTFTLSEGANDGFESSSKIAAKIDQLIIPASDVAEFLPATNKARKSIEEANDYNA